MFLGASFGMNYHVEGKYLVCKEAEIVLPNRCVVTNKPGQPRRTKTYCAPTDLDLATAAFYGTIVGQKVTVTHSLNRIRKLTIFPVRVIAFGLFIAGFGGACGGVVVAHEIGVAQGLAVSVGCIAVSFLGWCLSKRFGEPIIAVKSVNGEAYLLGIHPEILDELKQALTEDISRRFRQQMSDESVALAGPTSPTGATAQS